MKETSRKFEQQTLWDISTSTCSQESAHFLSALAGPTTQAASELYQQASPVSRSLWPEIAKENRTIGIFGQRSAESFANLDPSASFWRMSLGCFQQTKGKRWERFLQTWPRGFLITVGEGLKVFAYELQILGHRINGKEYSLWPTPAATESGYNKSNSPNAQIRPTLTMMARKGLWPTPAAQDGKNASCPPSQARRATLPGAMWRTPQANENGSIAAPEHRKGHNLSISNQVQGKLNPEFVECLMGFPQKWTELEETEEWTEIV